MKKALIFLISFPFITFANTITVPVGTVYTIDPGTRVEMGAGERIDIFGTLVVNGTPAQSVTITSSNDNGSSSPSVGDWFGIVLESGSNAEIHNAIIKYATNGIYEPGTSTLSLIDNSFINNGTTAVINAGSDFVHSGNTASDTESGFRFIGATKDGGHITSKDLPVFVTSGFLTVPAGTNFTIDPGTTLKLDSTAVIDVYGKLEMLGTDVEPITLTSVSVAPQPRDWGGVLFENGSSGDLQNVTVEYAGNTALNPTIHSALYNLGANLNIQTFKALNVSDSVLYQTSGTTTISNSELANGYIAAWVAGGYLNISQSKIHNNGFYGVYNVGNTQVDARDNWWGSKDGPNTINNATSTGDRIYGDVLYTPWIGRDPALPNPVIIVPGIMGSTLVDASGTEVWMNLLKMSLPGSDSYLDDLQLSSSSTLTPLAVIQSVNVPLFKRDIFSGLISNLASGGYIESQDQFAFPYDWRQDIAYESGKLANEISEVKKNTGAAKVDIVAHSMGGLVVKDYLKKFGGNDIARLLDLATPHTGAPSSLNTIAFGNTDISILNQREAEKITQNMPSVYELLPSQKYFDASSSDYKYYVFNGENTNKLLSFADTKQYLKDAGRNAALVDLADNFHQDIDGLDPAQYGVKTYNIVGCGTPTIGQFYILGKDKNGDTEYDIKMINGDGTVPLKSAEAIPAAETYFVKNAVHATLPSTTGVKDLVADILSGKGDTNLFKYSNISTSESDCPKVNGTIVSFHSPITLDAYDQSGNHSGPDANGDIEQNIPGSDYEVIDNNKFIFLPTGGQYTIKGKSLGSGTFGVRVETVVDDQVTNTTYWNDIPLNPLTQTQFIVGQTVPTYIALDNNGDGTFESTREKSGSEDGFVDAIPQDPKLISDQGSMIAFIPGGVRNEVHVVGTTAASSTPQYTPKRSVFVPKIKSLTVQALTTTDNSSNSAVVYKSGSRAMYLLRSIWDWFKRKL